LNEELMKIAGAGGVHRYVGFCDERNQSIRKRHCQLVIRNIPHSAFKSSLSRAKEITFLAILQRNRLLEAIQSLVESTLQRIIFTPNQIRASHKPVSVSRFFESVISSVVFCVTTNGVYG
jgi:hypothetical protein